MTKLLCAVHPNAGVRIAYQKRLDALIAKMQRSVVWWVRAAYRKDEARIVSDFEVDTETGEITKGNVGQTEWNSPSAQGARRDKVEDAVREIANGKAEATVAGLRNDLEQYGGTNDVTIIRGDEKKGLLHIEKRHGSGCIAPVLEAVANGKIARFVKGNKTVHLDKDGYRAVLSLEKHGKKKTWLLTGYDIVGEGQKNVTGDSGKVSARHAATHTGPILSRPDMGAVSSFIQRIEQILAKSNVRESAHG